MYSTLCAFGVRTTHVLAGCRVNDPGHSYESVKHWMAGYREQDILYLLTSVNLHFSPPAWKKKRDAHAHTRTHVWPRTRTSTLASRLRLVYKGGKYETIVRGWSFSLSLCLSLSLSHTHTHTKSKRGGGVEMFAVFNRDVLCVENFRRKKTLVRAVRRLS